jgi:chromosome segregation ATPase
VWSNEIQNYEGCKVSVANLIKQIKTLEKEKVEAKKSFITKMEVFEKKWVEVTKTIKVVSSVQKETNKLWNINQELKETLSKDVETLHSQVAQLVSSQQANHSLSQISTEINSLATLRQKVETTKDLLNANSLAIYSAISKVTSAPMESEKFIDEVKTFLY